MMAGKNMGARPLPPAALTELRVVGDPPSCFEPAHELADWVRIMFIEDGAPLINEDHAHLRWAKVCFLWAGVTATRHGRRILGQTERGKPMTVGGKWQRARAEMQIAQWFGREPDFIITLDAQYAQQAPDAEFCALIEHELYHCGQERDEFGAPKFSSTTGLPIYAIRAHDVEEFVGVVRRYGSDATNISDMVEAAQQEPEIAKAKISNACGNCIQRVK